jgi:hypothetical protein
MNLTCPNCGHPIPATARKIVMQTCASCDTTLYRQGDALLNAGSAGEMHETPGLFGLGDIVKLGRKAWEVLGHARFSYGRGWWDEFWCEDPTGLGAWVSVDEGDIVIQFPLGEDQRPSFTTDVGVGHKFRFLGEDFTVIEHGEGSCVALRGLFGERLGIGDSFRYANAQGNDGALLSCERDGSGMSYFIGEWHDPFEISGEAPA